MFEGKESSHEDTVAKIYEDSHHWFEAQKAGMEEEQSELAENTQRNRWEAPKGGDLKCNVAVKWLKKEDDPWSVLGFSER